MPVRQADVGDEEDEIAEEAGEVKQEPDDMLNPHCFYSMLINPEICIVVRFRVNTLMHAAKSQASHEGMRLYKSRR